MRPAREDRTVSGRVLVFAPLEQLGVTMEQVADRPQLRLRSGGQVIWEAQTLAALGVQVSFCATAGWVTGALLRQQLGAEGITVCAVDRETPTGWYLTDERTDAEEPLACSAGASLTEAECEQLHRIALDKAARSAVVILAGPMDKYQVDPGSTAGWPPTCVPAERRW
jgi:1-phosphofructokinase